MSWWTNIVSTVQKDEKWVAAELAKGWHLLQSVGHTIQVDAVGIENWLNNNHSSTVALFKGALTAIEAVGSVLPQSAPAVAIATTAIDAATAAVDAISKSVLAGPTPLSTLVNGYHAVKDAQNAVNTVLKQGTTKPQ